MRTSHAWMTVTASGGNRTSGVSISTSSNLLSPLIKPRHNISSRRLPGDLIKRNVTRAPVIWRAPYDHEPWRWFRHLRTRGAPTVIKDARVPRGTWIDFPDHTARAYQIFVTRVFFPTLGRDSSLIRGRHLVGHCFIFIGRLPRHLRKK